MERVREAERERELNRNTKKAKGKEHGGWAEGKGDPEMHRRDLKQRHRERLGPRRARQGDELVETWERWSKQDRGIWKYETCMPKWKETTSTYVT